MNPTLKKIWNLISWVLVSAVVLLAILLAGVRVVGLTPYAVLSGSMEPTYPVGSMIYVKAADPADVEVGDPITFYLGEGLIATHRVVSIDGAGFHTKGDANNAEDGTPVAPANLIGRPRFCIPGLGYFSAWIAEPPGTYIAGCGALALLVLMFVPELLDAVDAADKRDAERKKKEKS